MVDIDSLVVSLLDSEAMIGCFKKELSKALDIPVDTIKEVWLETVLVNNVASQVIKVSFVDAEISKEKLMDLKFKAIYENTIIFEVGDLII